MSHIKHKNSFTWMREVRRTDAHHRVRAPVFHRHYTGHITDPSIPPLHITTRGTGRTNASLHITGEIVDMGTVRQCTTFAKDLFDLGTSPVRPL